MPTTNPVPSTDPTDLLFNAGKLDEVVNGTANSFTDRLGIARRTVAGMNADFDAQLADAESDLNVYRADAAASAAEALGYLQTIRATSYGAYAEDPATDPLGNPPTVGDEYFNTTANLLKRWNGSTWQASDINTANLAAPSGSSLIGYMPPGTGSVATTVQSKLRETVSVKDFGAVGGGVDCTNSLVNALAAVPVGGLVSGVPGETYDILGRVDINGRTLSNIKLKLTGNNAFLVLSGAASLRNVEIDGSGCQRSFGYPLFGYVNLHNSNGVEIDGLFFKNGKATSSGIFCSTKASNTNITRCNFEEVGFGVYFLDDERVAGVDVRVVDGVSYTGSIGSGLSVSFSKLGNAAKTQAGDGIEIDVPVNRFDTIDVSHCIVRGKTPSGPKTGLGMGFANVDQLSVGFNKFIGHTASPGALHIEKTTAATLFLNQFKECYVGIGGGIEGDDSIISQNTFNSCNQPIVINGSASASYKNIKIQGNNLINTTGYPLQLVDVKDATVSGNTLRNITVADRQMIYLVQSLQASIDNIKIHDNTFIRDNGLTGTILQKSGNVLNVFTKDNMFDGIGASEIAAYYTLARQIGLCEEYVRSGAATLAGMTLKTNGNPTGYVTAPAGTLVRDMVNNIDYRTDGTNWMPFVYKRGFATYDPPSLADGAGVTTTVTVTGATIGDFAEASFGADLQGITLTAWVSATNTVSVRFQNETSGTVDLPSGTLRAQVVSK